MQTLSRHFRDKRYFRYDTNGANVSPIFTLSGGEVMRNRMGDGVVVTSNSFTHNFSPSGIYTNFAWVREPSNVTNVDIGTDNLTLVDCTYLSNCVAFNFMSNSLLTTFIPPAVSNVTVIAIRLENCDITGSLDLSTLTSVSGLCRLQNNNNMTNLVLPSAPVASMDFALSNTMVTNALDFSLWSNLNNIFNFQSNDLTVLTMPTSNSNSFTTFNISSNNNLILLDVSGMLNIGPEFKVESNLSLTTLTMPTNVNTNSFTSFRITGNSICTGTLDLTGLEGINGNINVFNNDFNQIDFPTTSGNVDKVQVNSNDINVNLDFSGMTYAAGAEFICNTNLNLPSITFPTTGVSIINVTAFSCGLTTVDFSPMTNLSGKLDIGFNNSLATATFPATANVFDDVDFNSCAFITFDISNLTGLSGFFSIAQNSGLTTLTVPASTGLFTGFEANGCALTTLDLSPLTNLGGDVMLSSNGMTTLTLTANTNTFINLELFSNALPYINLTGFTNMMEINNGNYEFQNNAWTAAEINQMLVDADTMTTGGFTGRVWQGDGTNAAPDTTSGGFNGSAAKTNLIGKGFTVITN